MAIGRSEFTGKWYGTVDFGGRVTSIDGDEARAQRYRDLRSGIYANNLVAGRRTQDWSLEAQAWNIGYRDQRYQLDFDRVGRLRASFLYDQIPLWISADTKTLYVETQPGVFRLEDSMQQTIQAGQATLHSYTDQAVRFDLETMRRIGQADVVFNATPNTDIVLQIKNTNRDGHIPFGGTFGFSNAVEIPMPLNHRTTDLKTAIEWSNNTGLARFGWDGSTFDNTLESVVWDNPLRFGPDIVGGPSQGRHASWPDNTLTYLHGTGAVNIPLNGRLTAYAAFGQGRNSTRPAAPHHQHGVRAAAAAGAHHCGGRKPDDHRQFHGGDAAGCRVLPQRALSLQRRRRADAGVRPLDGLDRLRHQPAELRMPRRSITASSDHRLTLKAHSR